MPTIIRAEPPLIAEIDAVFHTRGKPVIYSWGDTIFAPHNEDVSPALRAHEAVHAVRQKRDAETADEIERNIIVWWRNYIADAKFRLDEEIPAHYAEYQWHLAQPYAHKPFEGWRARHQFHKHHIAMRLAGPLYGKLISIGEAKRLISE